MAQNFPALVYIAAGVLFIMALRGLSSPETSRAGNRYGMFGMFIAVRDNACLFLRTRALAHGPCCY